MDNISYISVDPSDSHLYIRPIQSTLCNIFATRPCKYFTWSYIGIKWQLLPLCPTKPRSTRVKYRYWDVYTCNMVPLLTSSALHHAFSHLGHPTCAINWDFLSWSDHCLLWSPLTNVWKHFHLPFLKALPEMFSHPALVEMVVFWSFSQGKRSSKCYCKKATVVCTSLNWHIHKFKANLWLLCVD